MALQENLVFKYDADSSCIAGGERLYSSHGVASLRTLTRASVCHVQYLKGMSKYVHLYINYSLFMLAHFYCHMYMCICFNS